MDAELGKEVGAGAKASTVTLGNLAKYLEKYLKQEKREAYHKGFADAKALLLAVEAPKTCAAPGEGWDRLRTTGEYVCLPQADLKNLQTMVYDLRQSLKFTEQELLHCRRNLEIESQQHLTLAKAVCELARTQGASL